MNQLEARRRILGRNVYKRTTEGNPAIAQGSLARMYPGITMQGWTEQAQYEGNQLFDKTGVELTSMPLYIGINVGDGQFTLSTDYTGNAVQRDIFFLPGNVTSGASSNINGVKSGAPRTVTSVDGYVTVAMRKQNDDDLNPENYHIMLNSGSTALTYEPYTGGAPSPSPEYPQEIVSAGTYGEETGKWEYEVKLTGKNLFNPAKLTGGEIVEYNGIQCYKYRDGTTNFTYKDKFLENTQYCFNVICLSSEGNEEKPTDIKIWYTDGTMIVKGVFHNQLANIVSSANKTVDKITGNSDYAVIRYIDLSITTLGIGTEPVQYEPYKEQSLTITSDRPLTKWDKLEKRNGQWGWVYKSEEIESYTDESVPGEYFSTTGRLSTGAQVWYETTTETFVPLSESEQEAMNALYTFRPTTVLSNDCDCNMTLTYKTKKSLEVTD